MPPAVAGTTERMRDLAIPHPLRRVRPYFAARSLLIS